MRAPPRRAHAGPRPQPRGRGGAHRRRTAVDASRFDAVARGLAGGLPRRRAVKLLAALGLGGVLVRATSRPAAYTVVNCPEVSCPTGQCVLCSAEYNRRLDMWVCSCRCGTCEMTGIVGGGALRTAGGGEAHLALLATRTAVPDRPDAFAVVGQVRWSDPAWEGTGLELESINVAVYGPLPDVEGGREAVGWMRTGQRPGEYPF